MRAAATFASDVYSLAVLANEVACGRPPYEGAERPDAQLQTVVETTYTTPALCRAVVAGRRPDLAQFMAPGFPQLVESAWAADAAARPTANVGGSFCGRRGAVTKPLLPASNVAPSNAARAIASLSRRLSV